MNLFFRMLRVFLFLRFQSKLDILESCRTYFRVWPTDIDVLMHMNNGRYLTLMDLGRVNLMMRCGIMQMMHERNYYPVLAAETIRFKKSLKPFQRFYIQTKVLAWDEKYIYLEQIFYANDTVYAHAIVKARILHKNGEKISPQQCLQAIGKDITSPEFPEYLKSWIPVSEL